RDVDRPPPDLVLRLPAPDDPLVRGRPARLGPRVGDEGAGVGEPGVGVVADRLLVEPRRRQVPPDIVDGNSVLPERERAHGRRLQSGRKPFQGLISTPTEVGPTASNQARSDSATLISRGPPAGSTPEWSAVSRRPSPSPGWRPRPWRGRPRRGRRGTCGRSA